MWICLFCIFLGVKLLEGSVITIESPLSVFSSGGFKFPHHARFVENCTVIGFKYFWGHISAGRPTPRKHREHFSFSSSDCKNSLRAWSGRKSFFFLLFAVRGVLFVRCSERLVFLQKCFQLPPDEKKNQLGAVMHTSFAFKRNDPLGRIERQVCGGADKFCSNNSHRRGTRAGCSCYLALSDFTKHNYPTLNKKL